MKKNTKKNNDMTYDENVNYDLLEQHLYEDTGDVIFYTCPKCGGEYLATFIVEEDGETMCIDCCNRN
jgi:DNA-directed RNA polymerase subunit M/transcription elongation factor TFIIS